MDKTAEMLDTQLTALAENAGAQARERHETIAVAESSCGGLISASLLSIPGASSYYVGGTVTYTRLANQAFLAGARPLARFAGRDRRIRLVPSPRGGGQAQYHVGDRRERRGGAVGQSLWRSGGSRLGRCQRAGGFDPASTYRLGGSIREHGRLRRDGARPTRRMPGLTVSDLLRDRSASVPGTIELVSGQ